MATTSELIHQQTQAAIAAGADPLGDNDPIEQVPEEEEEGETVVPPNDDTPPADDDTGEGEQPPNGGNAEIAPDADEDDEPAPVTYTTSGKDFDAEIQKLEEAMQAVDAKWESGELTDAERRTQMADLRSQERTIISDQAKDAALQQVSEQNIVASQTKVLRGIADASKKAGELDYTDPKIGDAFDAMFKAVAADPDNAGKSFKENAALTHKALCAVRGVKVAPADDTKTGGKPAARTSPAVPTTLRGIPSAATPNTGGDKLDALGRLSGQNYQAAFKSLSAAEKARLLDE